MISSFRLNGQVYGELTGVATLEWTTLVPETQTIATTTTTTPATASPTQINIVSGRANRITLLFIGNLNDCIGKVVDFPA